MNTISVSVVNAPGVELEFHGPRRQCTAQCATALKSAAVRKMVLQPLNRACQGVPKDERRTFASTRLQDHRPGCQEESDRNAAFASGTWPEQPVMLTEVSRNLAIPRVDIVNAPEVIGN